VTPNSSNLRTRATGYIYERDSRLNSSGIMTDVYTTVVAWTVKDIYNNVAPRKHPTEIVKCDGIDLNRETCDVQLSCDSYRRLRRLQRTRQVGRKRQRCATGPALARRSSVHTRNAGHTLDLVISRSDEAVSN